MKLQLIYSRRLNLRYGCCCRGSSRGGGLLLLIHTRVWKQGSLERNALHSHGVHEFDRFTVPIIGTGASSIGDGHFAVVQCRVYLFAFVAEKRRQNARYIDEARFEQIIRLVGH